MEKLKEIMVVDDEAGIRALLSDALIQGGFRVTLAKKRRGFSESVNEPSI